MGKKKGKKQPLSLQDQKVAQYIKEIKKINRTLDTIALTLETNAETLCNLIEHEVMSTEVAKSNLASKIIFDLELDNGSKIGFSENAKEGFEKLYPSTSAKTDAEKIEEAAQKIFKRLLENEKKSGTMNAFVDLSEFIGVSQSAISKRVEELLAEDTLKMMDEQATPQQENKPTEALPEELNFSNEFDVKEDKDDE